MSLAYDLTTPGGRFKTYWDYNFKDHAFLRAWFQNAHWVSPELVRTNQPSPNQLKRWKDRGVRTIINLRGGFDGSFYALERDACQKLGLNLIDFTVTSRAVPSREKVKAAKEMFETLEYPALMHCKSGADRAGIMSVLYCHFRLGESIEQASRHLSLKYLHMEAGKTGVLDYVFDRYLQDAAPKGLTFMQWVESDAYDPVQIKAEFVAKWWGTIFTEGLLKRE
jgi:protein tyrosine/serine phosphatase